MKDFWTTTYANARMDTRVKTARMLGSVSRILVRMEERASKREARTSANAMKDLKAQPVQRTNVLSVMFMRTARQESASVTLVSMEMGFEANVIGQELLIRDFVFQILAYMVDHVTKSQMAIVVSVHLVTKAITVSFPSATMQEQPQRKDPLILVLVTPV